MSNAYLEDISKKIRVVYHKWLARIGNGSNFLVIDPGIGELLILADGILKSVDFKLN